MSATVGLNYLSLFSGIGGLDLGLDRAGMTCVGQVEKDEFCRRVLAKHWPEVPRHDDVRTVPNWWDARARPAVHVVAGGFPCQPFSLAGRQLGAEDERYLWPALMDVVRHLRPAWVLLENVPGLLRRGLGDVLGDLAAGGYDAEWDCIPAASIGAPHLRDRIFVVAYPNGDAERLQPVGESRSCGTAVAGDDGPARHVAHADQSGRDERSGLVGDGGRRSESSDRRPDVADAHGAGLGERRGAVAVSAPQPAAERSGESVADAQGVGRGTRRARRPVGDGAHGSAIGPEELAHTEGGRRDPSRPHRRQARPERVFGHAGQRRGVDAWAAEPDVGRVAHGVPARVDRLRALGNAVVPQVGEHVGRLVVTAANALADSRSAA